MRDLRCEGDDRFRRAYASTREGSPPGIAIERVGSGKHITNMLRHSKYTEVTHGKSNCLWLSHLRGTPKGRWEKRDQKLKFSADSPMSLDSCSVWWLGGKFLEGATGAPKEKPGVQARALTSICGAEGGETLCALRIRFRFLNLVKAGLRFVMNRR